MTNVRVKVINTDGLDNETISKIEPTMTFANNYYEDNTLFFELRNSKEEIIRIFPERVEEIKGN